MASADAEGVGLSWPGKGAALAAADEPAAGRLEACPASSLRPERARHTFVEGENLAVLRLLEAELHGRVGMLYLDPPYNTGEVMTFRDDYRAARGGRGGRHAAWLSAMAPRLLLGRRLLRDDGLLFVSIDDHEVAHLRLLLDELYGEDRFLGAFVWRRRTGALDARTNLSADHEYVLCYTKATGRLAGVPRSFDGYANPDGDQRGPWIADNLSANKPGGDTHYAITDPATNREYWPPPGRHWPYNPATMAAKIAEGRILFPRRPDGSPMLKRFQREARRTHRPVSTWIASPQEPATGDGDDAVALVSGYTTEGTRTLKRVLGERTFTYPKPVSLLRSLVLQATRGDDLVLDYFAGTGTIAQAVVEANAADGGRRRFCCVQQAEPLAGSAYPTIAALAVERIRRVLPAGEGVRVLRLVE
jgi:adenine-specific DNA-methyltransferase